MLHAPVGLVELNENGDIITINLVGGRLLDPIAKQTLAAGSNLFGCLAELSPEIATRIQNFSEPAGLILHNQHYSYQNQPTAKGRKHFQLTVTKIFKDCLIVSIEDMTDKVQEEEALMLAQQDKAVAQGKYEIASEVIHDIGNAVVGFGSYLTRINRILEQYNEENLQKVAAFLKQQQDPIATAIGIPKATALVDMIDAISRSLGDSHQELRKSVNDQLQLITHIQDILNIQRQYISGHESQERRPVNLKDIINDCRSMVFANLEKRGIELQVTLPQAHIEIRGDRTKLMQVVLNILKNSIEAIDMSAKEKSIQINLSETEDSARLTIADSGKGFDQQTAEHLFDRGYTTKNTGSGLGLYNCKAIIESHAGSIHIESDGVDRGSKTTIIIKK
jgi:signal transduction histidine kinase